MELAVAATAETIVSSDDLLVLYPWRGVRVLRRAEYLERTGPARPSLTPAYARPLAGGDLSKLVPTPP